MTTHTIEPGDWIGAIATTRGLSHWSVIWDHPANAELRQLRGSPDLLMVGDDLHVPDPGDPPGITIHTGRRVELRLRAPDRLRIRWGALDLFLRAFGPVPYELKIGSETFTGTLANPGDEISAPLPSDATSATLTLMETETFELPIGGLGPASEGKGAYARLVNLGFGGVEHEPEEGEQVTDPLTAALRVFQSEHELPATGELDAPTSTKLRDVYGG